ncbi:MAG: ATP-binding cassette domain-containing protein [Evtepia sp.]
MLVEQDILLRAKGVQQHFTVKRERGRKATLYAVDGVDLAIHSGETFGLVGESGCGKSTLGKSLLRLYPLTGGTIEFDDVDISNLKERQLGDLRQKTQMIFQDPASCLNPRRRVEDILTEPFAIHKLYTKEERHKRVLELCDQVGLSPSYLMRYPHEMSGGQKQRVGIARAIALHPKLIVCDEAVSALDVSIQAQVINLLEDLQEEYHLTYLFISHNLSVVEHCCQRIAVMYLGRIVEELPAEKIAADAMHPYTKALISAVPTIEEHGGISRERIVLAGDLPSPTEPPSGCAFHTRCPYVTTHCRTDFPQLHEIAPNHFVACHLCKP